MSTYRIRPLEWEHWTDKHGGTAEETWEADTIGGSVTITRTDAHPGYCVHMGGERIVLATIELAKLWCAKRHRRAVEMHLEVVI